MNFYLQGALSTLISSSLISIWDKRLKHPGEKMNVADFSNNIVLSVAWPILIPVAIFDLWNGRKIK